MNKIHLYQTLYMDIAHRVAQMSYDRHTKVGSVIVKDGNILSTGWNGMPPGFLNSCKDDTGKTRPEVIHSEVNAIYKLAKQNGNAYNSQMYITHAPCTECCKAILMSGITSVFYKEHRDDNGLHVLKHQVNVTKL